MTADRHSRPGAQSLTDRVAALEEQLSGVDGTTTSLTQAVGFLAGVLEQYVAPNTLAAFEAHFILERSRLAASGKFDAQFLAAHEFVTEIIVGTATALVAAMKKAADPHGS